MHVTMMDPVAKKMLPKSLLRKPGGHFALEDAPAQPQGETLYLSPPWIDSHVHIFHGVNFGLLPDDIGYRTGVHLLVDAGSAGVETLDAFKEYIVGPAKTKVLAFLNVSGTGLVTLREYRDAQQIRPEDTARAILDNPGLLLGVKVRSSGYIVESAGLAPFQAAVKAAELADCPIMVHMGEAPPTNEENLPLFRGGDIITHCFHGKQPPDWNGAPLWHPDGTPISAMKAALERGTLLDVGHGEASFSAAVAAPVMARGEYEFSISTDLHGLSYPEPVYSLGITMSKFLALGMPLNAVIRAVTEIPARRFGLDGWCGAPQRNGTLFRVRKVQPDDPPFVDARREAMAVQEVIEPVAVIMDGQWISIDPAIAAPV